MRKLLLPLIGCLFFSNVNAFSLNGTDEEKIVSIFYLSRTKNPAYVDEICKILKNGENSNLRKAAAQALGIYTFDKRAESCLLNAFKLEKNKDVKLEILNSLIGFKGEKEKNIFCSIIKRKDEDEKVKQLALKGLVSTSSICYKDVVSLLNSSNPEIVANAVYVLSFHPVDKNTLNRVSKFLDSKNKEVQLAALEFFFYHKPNTSILKKIKDLMNNTFDTTLKLKAMKVLVINGAMEGDEIIDNLSSEDLEESFSEILPVIKDKKTAKKVVSYFLKNGGTEEIVSALSFIGRSGDKAYCNLLPSFILSKNDDVRYSAIWAASKLDCENSFNLILNVIGDINNDDSLRLYAAKSLKNFSENTLKRYRKKLEYLYENEILDDIKGEIRKVLK